MSRRRAIVLGASAAALLLVLGASAAALLLVVGLGLASITTVPDVAGVAARVRPATVRIVNLTRAGGVPSSAPPTERRPRPVPQGLGTGFIYDPAGYIVTNNHVVEDADRLQVHLPPPSRLDPALRANPPPPGQVTFAAHVVGRDPQLDLAVVKIEAADRTLPTVQLGRSDTLRIGEWVVAVGNALDLPGGPTVTAGVVSALDRAATETVSSGDGASVVTTLSDLVQTDASINPGNSGGPLVNLRGEVIGINTLIASEGQDIGFAIAIDSAKAFVLPVQQADVVVRQELGLGAAAVPPGVAAANNRPEQNGVLVATIVPAGPAAEAGLRPGDVLVEIGGSPVNDVRDLQAALTSPSVPGERLNLRLTRRGSEQTVAVTRR